MKNVVKEILLKEFMKNVRKKTVKNFKERRDEEYNQALEDLQKEKMK